MTLPIQVKVKKLHPDAKLPTQAYKGDAGWDLYALHDAQVIMGHVTEVKLGVAFEIPYGYQMHIHTRSSFGKRGLKCHLGVVDAGYRGELTIWITSVKPIWYDIKKGDKIAQVIFSPVLNINIVETDKLNPSERGEKGYGSSGR